MPMLKKVLLAVVVVYVCVLLSGFLLPAQTLVSRSIDVNASQALVFKLVSEHKQFQLWSPWAAKDPNMQLEFEGPAIGLGSKLIWRSEHPQVGNGESVYSVYEPYSEAAFSLSFDQGGGDASFYLDEIDSQNTRVVWQFKTEHGNVFERFIGFFLLEDMLAPDFESGLASLKTLAESRQNSQPVTREITYKDGELELTGFVASPANSSEAPVVLVVHEWWGHNDYARQRARMLAELGYNAFAIDMYGKGRVATHPADAKSFMMEVVSNAEVLHSRFDAALDFISSDASLADKPLAVIGYCFGGSVAMSMARANKPVAGVVSFHGGLKGLHPIVEGASAPVLVLNGEADPMVAEADVAAFEAEMSEAGIATEIIHYKDAKHAFTSKKADEFGEKFGLPLAYNEAADKQSWSEMQSFLDELFKAK